MMSINVTCLEAKPIAGRTIPKFLKSDQIGKMTFP